MSSLEHEILRRRTFAIISHPDAGKTTLTEKLLLFGGAIRLYEALGFQQIGVRRGYYQAAAGREDALVMRRAVDAV